MSAPDLPLIQRLRLRENHIFFALTIVIGIFAGLAAVLFTLAIKGTTYLLFGVSPSILRYILVPTGVSLVTGFLLARFFPEARGSGVPQTEAAYHIYQGHVPARVAFGKFLTGVLCIGSGHSMGREGPSVQIGAGIASSIGKQFHLSSERARSLIPVASAAALSAAFNTPIAAVLFALEEIIGDLNAALLGSTVVASVASVIVERSILGNNPIFHVPQYHLVSSAELLAYAVLGVVGGAVSLAFCKGMLWLRAIFLRMPGRTRIYQPAMGGLMIGIILIFCPQALGVGYEYADQALNGGLLLRTLVLLCTAKLIATVISYASGNAGGIFAPSLYLGAMAGGAIGVLVHRFAPFPTGDPGAYALVGMGTLFAGIIRAPMTSVFMIFELTQDYQVLVPLMIANMISFLISTRYQPIPLYRALLDQDHVHLPKVGFREPAGTWRARDIMTREFVLLSPVISVEDAARMATENEAGSFLVGDNGLYSGLVTRDQIEQALQSGLATTPISTLVIKDHAHVHPDQPLELVLERLGKNPGILPVVSRGEVRHVEGVITPQTMIQYFQKAWNGGSKSSTNA
ncbi:MAG TPA: chloride channel protein [Acidobacteriaceae bacterium]|jgi:CIC family chloride channel protein|nr:chloride channel protein [Acidobacteriaceae bacterium]